MSHLLVAGIGIRKCLVGPALSSSAADREAQRRVKCRVFLMTKGLNVYLFLRRTCNVYLG
jgi:hypothetical protein